MKSRQRRRSLQPEEGGLTSRSRCARRTDRQGPVLPPEPTPAFLMIPSTRTVVLLPEAAACCEARLDDGGDDVCGRPCGLRWRVQRKEPGWLVGEQRQVSLVPLGDAHDGLELVDGFAMVAWASDPFWILCWFLDGAQVRSGEIGRAHV